MGDKRNDGGPAFAHGSPEHGGHPGMTLRDWFAGQVMVALSTDIPFDMHTAVDRAKWAYMQADAMLAARAPDGVDGKGER